MTQTLAYLRAGTMRWHTLPVAIALISIVFSAGFAAGQSTTPETPAETRPVEHYRLGPGDLLSIRVFAVDDFGSTARVSNSGRIHVPHIGIVRANGLTLNELRDELARLLRQHELMRDPWVDVRIVEHRAQPVYILGEVMLPGQYLMKQPMRVIDLVTLTMGVNDKSSPIGYLYRRTSSPEAPVDESKPWVDEAIQIDLQGLLSGQRPDQNLELQAGDVLYVPERIPMHFFVTGDVGKPGVFELSAEKPQLLTQALFAAGGPLKTARTSKTQIVRFKPDGTREEVTVDLGDVLRGREPDVPIQPNDIVFIPGSSGKAVGYSLLQMVPGIVTRTLLFW